MGFDSVESLTNVVGVVNNVLSVRDLTSQQKQSLEEIVHGCRDVLKQLKETLENYQELDSSAKGISGKSRRVLKRIQWDQKEIDQFRSRVSWNIGAFGMFLGQITR